VSKNYFEARLVILLKIKAWYLQSQINEKLLNRTVNPQVSVKNAINSGVFLYTIYRAIKLQYRSAHAIRTATMHFCHGGFNFKLWHEKRERVAVYMCMGRSLKFIH